jgi:hypothetical protein
VPIRIAAVLLLLWFAGTVAQSQPVNDHFTNRTLLLGNSFTFTANLDGATREQDEPLFLCEGAWAVRSVWFEWRPSESIPVFVQVLQAVTNVQSDALVVYASTNLAPSGFTVGLPTIACMPVFTGMERPFVAFNAEPDRTYYLHVHGSSRGAIQFQLDASQAPVIVGHPRHTTVNPGGATLLKSAAIWLSTPRYQWLRDGATMPGETSPMLQLTNVQPFDAGAYSVVVQNDAAPSTSSVANVTVITLTTGPALAIAHSLVPNSFDIRLAAETGRAYRLEYATNLTGWAPELIVGSNPQTSVVLQTNAEVSVTVVGPPGQKFFRVGSYVPPSEVCNANLKRIRHAKELWARDAHRYYSYEAPTLADLDPYYRDGVAPRCPAGGYYAINALDQLPTCSHLGHILEEPR